MQDYRENLPQNTSFSVMAEMVKVEHAASLFLGPDGHSKQASGMFCNAN
jgi:hypothetical protein